MTATASAINAAEYGEYRIRFDTLPRFRSRVVAGGGPGALTAEPGRYHLYSACTSPASHRLELIRALAGLDDAVSVSHVHGLRDARGWAFRDATGADRVNGFTLLRQAYEATSPGYPGEVRVPLLWDRHEGCIVSDDAVAIGVDLATQFDVRHQLYPVELASEIERVSASVEASFSDRVVAATVRPDVAAGVRSALRRLDGQLVERRYLLGDQLTDTDLRLWVHLVRYDVGSNAHRSVGPALSTYPALWCYARALFDRPAFRTTRTSPPSPRRSATSRPGPADRLRAGSRRPPPGPR